MSYFLDLLDLLKSLIVDNLIRRLVMILDEHVLLPEVQSGSKREGGGCGIATGDLWGECKHVVRMNRGRGEAEMATTQMYGRERVYVGTRETFVKVPYLGRKNETRL